MAENNSAHSRIGSEIYRIIDRQIFEKDSPLHYDKCGEEILEFIEDELAPFLCKNLGHNFEVDQCLNPEHDFCSTCGEEAVNLGYVRTKDDYPQEWSQNATKTKQD